MEETIKLAILSSFAIWVAYLSTKVEKKNDTHKKQQ